MSEQYELSIMLFDATGKAVRPVFSRKVPAEIGERVFEVLTTRDVEEEVDAASEIHRIINEPECTCYEIIGGHQQGCAFYGVKRCTGYRPNCPNNGCGVCEGVPL